MFCLRRNSITRSLKEVLERVLSKNSSDVKRQ